MTSPSPAPARSRTGVPRQHQVTAPPDGDTVSTGTTSLTARLVTGQTDRLPGQRSPLAAGAAVLLLRRWSEDRSSPAHLRELVTCYRDWPAVALALGELTSAELREREPRAVRDLSEPTGAGAPPRSDNSVVE